MVQPCSITMWPTVTFSPMVSGLPGSACSTLPSWMLLWAPMRTGSGWSPRTTAPNHTLAPSPSSTLPMTWALSATQAVSAMRGVRSSSWYTAMRCSPRGGLLRCSRC